MSRYFFQLYFTGISEQCGTLARNINGWRTGKDSSRKRITYCISHTSILICWYMLVKGNKKNPQVIGLLNQQENVPIVKQMG